MLISRHRRRISSGSVSIEFNVTRVNCSFEHWRVERGWPVELASGERGIFWPQNSFMFMLS